MTPVQMILSIGVLIVNGSIISDGWNQTTESVNTISKDQVEKELNLLCEKLDEKKYDQNRTLWKLKMIPVESWVSEEKVIRKKSVGLFSWSLNISYEKLKDLLTQQWIEDKFHELQQKSFENRKSVIPGRILPVNALVVVDKALDSMVANSIQFVKEFIPLVNHLLRSIRIEIKISDIVLESSQKNFAFLEPLDEQHGLRNLHKPSAAFWEAQTRDLSHDIVLVMSGLNICLITGSYDQPFNCKYAGFARQLVSGWPFYRKHSCAHKTAIVEVQNPDDTVSKWQAASTTAHEIVHLIGNTQHDGEDDHYGGGPGGQDCRGENLHMMAPSISFVRLYRVCKDFELWSECTIQQVKFYTTDWTRFCPGSFFTYHEKPLYYGLPILLMVALAALLYFFRKKQLAKDKETASLKDETPDPDFEHQQQQTRELQTRSPAPLPKEVPDTELNLGLRHVVT